ncbi:hypothetical protein KFK09_024079 [Dendrobium nobile]|uniref:RNase H type-1 domain-containing protein n=1 Tax=Dendrobium nobile TaxID=94219 RepID=A0A8T3ACU5_DENNO|nr:hypothetical protein KFK09_024079 [Dendrobium nobile]
MHHVFISGPVAVRTWIYFDDLFNLNCFNIHLSLNMLLKAWFINSKGHIRNCIPCLILWFLWLERNNSIFNGVKMNRINVIQRIKDKILALVNVNLFTLKSFSNYFHITSSLGISWLKPPNALKVLYWIKPPSNGFKLNVHGSDTGCGGLIRNSYGHLIIAFTGSIHNGNKDYAIGLAILYGIQLCITLNLTNLFIEVTYSFNISPFKNLVEVCFDPNNFYVVREIKK